MLYAVSYAFMDSINVLSIAVIVALGVLLPAGRYKKVAPLLVAGNWFGVFALALLVTVVFSGFGELMQKILDSAAFGLFFFGVGVLTLVGTWLSKGCCGGTVSRWATKTIADDLRDWFRPRRGAIGDFRAVFCWADCAHRVASGTSDVGRGSGAVCQYRVVTAHRLRVACWLGPNRAAFADWQAV